MKFDKITKIILACTLALFLSLSTASCAFMQETFADTYVTTEDNIKLENRDMVFPIPLDSLPQDVRVKFQGKGKAPVLAKGEDLVKPELAVEVSNPNKNTLGNIINVGLGVANAVWPGAGALAGLNFIFSRRSRGHMLEAGRQLNPFDEGYVDPKEAAISLARAMGLAHSSPESKAAFQTAKTA
jgi:hypothetical protein